MTVKINMRSVQEGVEDNSKKAREIGRKALLAYLGVWGLSYDAGKSIYSDGWKWVETAEKRGEKIEHAFVKATDSYQKSIIENVNKIAHKVEDGAKQVLEEVVEIERRVQQLRRFQEGLEPADGDVRHANATSGCA